MNERIPGFNPPSLSTEKATLVQGFSLRLLFHGTRLPELNETQRLLTAYMVTTDKAMREYSAACTVLRQYANEGKTTRFFEGVGQFENCIGSAKRAMRVLRRLAAGRANPYLDRGTRNIIAVKEATLTPFRNSIEHLDGDIMDGVQEGDAHLLSLNPEGTHLEIGTNSMQITALHEILTLLHAAGKEILDSLSRESNSTGPDTAPPALGCAPESPAPS